MCFERILGKVKKGRESKTKWLTVVITFAVPFLLLLAGVILFIQTTVLPKKIDREMAGAKEALLPSEVLNNKSRYNQQRIIIRGKVSPEPVVCQRQECPENDSCCGCPSERNLLIKDAGALLRPKTKGRLRILGSDGHSLCQRRLGSCDYDCGDWKEGGIYEVKGFFSAEPPPRGWKISLDYYFQAEEKRLVGIIGFSTSLENAFQEIGEFFKNFTTSGSYVLY
jgi:hypothetical protein